MGAGSGPEFLKAAPFRHDQIAFGVGALEILQAESDLCYDFLGSGAHDPAKGVAFDRDSVPAHAGDDFDVQLYWAFRLSHGGPPHAPRGASFPGSGPCGPVW